MESGPTTELLDYMLNRQKIEWHKKLGKNWMELEVPKEMITTRHSPVHTEDGFTNRLISTHVGTLQGLGKTTEEIRGFVATCVCFMDPKFIDLMAEHLMDSDFEIIQLPAMIAEFELDGKIPMVAFWQRAAAKVSSMQRQSQIDIETYGGFLPNLVNSARMRYKEELDFIEKVMITDTGSSEANFIKSIGGDLKTGIVAEILLEVQTDLEFHWRSDHEDTLATAYSGFWNGLANIFGIEAGKLTVEHLREVRRVANTKVDWIQTFKKYGGKPEKMKRLQFYVHNLCELRRRQKWNPRDENHKVLINDYMSKKLPLRPTFTTASLLEFIQNKEVVEWDFDERDNSLCVKFASDKPPEEKPLDEVEEEPLDEVEESAGVLNFEEEPLDEVDESAGDLNFDYRKLLFNPEHLPVAPEGYSVDLILPRRRHSQLCWKWRASTC